MILPLECGLRLPLCIAVNWCLRTFNKSQAIVRCRSWLGFYFSKLFFPYTLSVLWKILQGVAGDRINLTCPTILTLAAHRQVMLHYFQNSLCISAFLFSRVRSYHFQLPLHQYFIFSSICYNCMNDMSSLQSYVPLHQCVIMVSFWHFWTDLSYIQQELCSSCSFLRSISQKNKVECFQWL